MEAITLWIYYVYLLDSKDNWSVETKYKYLNIILLTITVESAFTKKEKVVIVAWLPTKKSENITWDPEINGIF